MARKSSHARKAKRHLTPDLEAMLQEFEAFLDFEDISESANRQKPFSARCGIYAFYDFAGEPIYVGQTKESLRTRIRRHMTNQRTDAVAMRALDPLEVADIEIWPFWELQEVPPREDKVRRKAIDDALNAAESTVYQNLLAKSKHGALLNEKIPKLVDAVKLPRSYRQRIVPEDVWRRLDHPDTRLARRTQKLAEMAQIFTQRDASIGLRFAMIAQAKRVLSLTQDRFSQLTAGKTQEQVMKELAEGEGDSD